MTSVSGISQLKRLDLFVIERLQNISTPCVCGRWLLSALLCVRRIYFRTKTQNSLVHKSNINFIYNSKMFVFIGRTSSDGSCKLKAIAARSIQNIQSSHSV